MGFSLYERKHTNEKNDHIWPGKELYAAQLAERV